VFAVFEFHRDVAVLVYSEKFMPPSFDSVEFCGLFCGPTFRGFGFGRFR